MICLTLSLCAHVGCVCDISDTDVGHKMDNAHTHSHVFTTFKHLFSINWM